VEFYARSLAIRRSSSVSTGGSFDADGRATDFALRYLKLSSFTSAARDVYSATLWPRPIARGGSWEQRHAARTGPTS
jgi:hypothetical protein